MQLAIVNNISELQDTLVEISKQRKRVGFVPTMGALHDGHISLINIAKQYSDVVVASIFVNPKQFGPNEDLAKYPRSLERDLEKLRQAGVGVAYVPTVEDMYPEGFSTTISAGKMGDILCGKFRPGHFDGVATVVIKLLLRVLPHVAVFGEKDYQQLAIIRRVVRDLDMPIEIVSGPTLREANGLAMSSRNLYLLPAEREIASQLCATLQLAAKRLFQGESVSNVLEESKNYLVLKGFKPDYLELRHADSLEAMVNFNAPARLLVAAWLGGTRLIDNILLEPS